MMGENLVARLQAALAGRYTIERELGQGGTATVYLGRDLKHDRPVAIKVLRPELAASVGAERFLREIQIAAHLQHPHILPLHDSGEADGFLYFVMPTVDGESLRQKLTREGALPISEVVRILAEIADALAYAHGHGIVHRDIKPENVMLSGRHAVVTDFGVAKAVSDAAPQQTLTTVGVVVGTPAYMAPEQVAADPRLDYRADIYALGVLAYELLTRRLPFAGGTPQQVLAAHVSATPAPVSRYREDVPTGLADIVMCCLAKQPEDRWQTADALVARLDRLATSGGDATSRPSVSLAVRRHRGLVLGAVTSMLVVLVIGYYVERSRAGPRKRTASPRIMIVVLPFENLGAAADQYFADGITEEITSRLAAVHGLGVISRTSAMQYRSAHKPLKQIGAELGVGYVLEGSVRWEKASGGSNRVRVTPQLIRVNDDTHLWADRYDAVLADVFQVQSAIAGRVTTALNIALREPERRALEAQPTANLEAYDAFLRGNSLATRTLQFVPEARRSAVRMYERATAFDSTFALAFARLAIAHLQVYFWYDDRSAARLAQAEQAAHRALAANPDLPEAHLALGLYYLWGWRDGGRAEEELTTALRARPDNAELLRALGRAQMLRGHWREARNSLDRAATFDPRSGDVVGDLAGTYTALREYAQATRWREREIAIVPDHAVAYVVQAWDFLRWRADTAEARRECQRGVQAAGRNRMVRVLFESSFAGALRGAPALWQLQDQETVQALDTLTLPASELRPEQYHVSKALWLAWTARTDRARAYADSARVALQRRLAEQPDEPNFHRELGLAYAVLGRRRDAVREGRRAVELLPIAKDGYAGPSQVHSLAQIYVMVGEPDSAVDQLQLLLSIPSLMSAPLLRVDPVFAPLRDNPRFQRLLEGRM